MSLHSLSTTLLDQPDLPLDVQVRIFEDGARDGTALLEKLACYPDLHPQVDAMFTEVKTARVLRVWLDREGRDLELVNQLAQKERRKTVLAVIADKAGLSQASYLAIAKRDALEAATVLMSNEDVGLRARKVALTQITANYARGRGTTSQKHACRAVLSNVDEALLPEVANAARGSVEVLSLVANRTMDPDTVATWLTAVEPHLRKLAEQHESEKNRRSYYRTAMSSLSTYAENLTALALGSDLPEGGLERIADLLSLIPPSDGYGGTNAALSAFAEIQRDGEKHAGLITSAGSGSTSRIDDALSYARGTKVASLQRQIMFTVLRNPQASAKQFRDAVDMGGYAVRPTALDIAIELDDSAKQEVALDLMYNAPDVSVISTLTDPAAICTKRVADWQGTYVHQILPYMRWMVDNGHAAALPAKVLLQSEALERVPELQDKILRPMVEEIAPAPSAWQTLSTLLDSYEGTIGELLDTVRVLCPDLLLDDTAPAADDALDEVTTEPDAGNDDAPPATGSQMSLL